MRTNDQQIGKHVPSESSRARDLTRDDFLASVSRYPPDMIAVPITDDEVAIRISDYGQRCA